MSTPNLNLPEMPANSFQPSVPFNESMQTLDAMTQLVPLSRQVLIPPTTVAGNVGQCWIVPSGASGAWATKATQIALCSAPGLWVYFVPQTGWYAHVRDENLLYRFNETIWEQAGAGSGAGIPDAPADGKLYGRKNALWVEVTGGGGGGGTAEDTTYDNATSGLTATNVQDALDELAAGSVQEAPVDGKQYARKDAGWTEVTGGGGSGLTYVQKLLAMGPVALYPLNETSGTSALDISGGNNHGTYSGGVTLGQPSITPGSTAVCPLFDGTSGFVTLPNNANLTLATASEFTAVVTGLYSVLSSASGTLLGKATSAARACQIDKSTGFGFWRTGSNAVNPTAADNPAKMFAGMPMTMALVRRRDEAGNPQVEAWVNGFMVGRITTEEQNSAGVNWTIGARFGASLSDVVNFMGGKIQNAAIYKRALSLAELRVATQGQSF